MKFKKYLINEGRAKGISLDEAVELTIKNASKNFKSIYMTGKIMPIYRGISEDIDYGYINSNKGGLRKSAYNRNYMTLLMDNLPSWNKYPKRSRGIISTTDKSKGYRYGTLKHAIPYDDVKVATAPADDIFFSFKFINDQGDVVKNFNNWMYDILHQQELDTQDDNFKKFKKELEQLDGSIKDGDLLEDHPYKKYNVFKKNKNIIDTLNKLISPIKNGFKLGVKNLQPDREVWFQGEGIYVAERDVDEYIEAVINEI